MKNILLHICCAPCAIFPVNFLRERGFKVKGFFFNPNIHPLGEYNRRLEAVSNFAKTSSLDVEHNQYEPKLFFQATYQKEEPSIRCHACWQLRLRQTALKAKEEGLEYFSSTLLGSPYQDTDTLEKIGKDLSNETKVEFFIADFKSGFRQAHNEAKALGIYCQKYCGCIYSEIERSNTKNKKACHK